MALFAKKENRELVAIFDIGNGSVSGALVEINPDVRPTILFTIREEIQIREKSSQNSFTQLFTETTKAIERVGKALLDAKLGAPTKTYCFLATPWYAGQTRIIKLEKTTPFIFTKKLWTDLSKKEIARFIDETVSADTDAVVIENKNMSVLCDGVEATDPIDKKVKSVEISVFVSVSSKNILDSFEHAIQRTFATVPIRFSSFLFAGFITVRDVFYDDAPDAVFIDLRSVITEVAVIKNNTLISSFSFPNGTGNILSSIREAFNVSLLETRSLLHLYMTDRLETKKKNKISSIVSREVSDWFTQFEKVTALSKKHETTPRKAFVIIDEPIAELFKFQEQFAKKAEALDVEIISGETFFKQVNPKDIENRDPFLMIESFFIKRVH